MPVLSGIDLETELFVSLYSVKPLVLQRISSNFVYDADSATFLLLVNNGSATLRLDHIHCKVKLWPTVALDRAEYVAGEAL